MKNNFWSYIKWVEVTVACVSTGNRSDYVCEDTDIGSRERKTLRNRTAYRSVAQIIFLLLPFITFSQNFSFRIDNSIEFLGKDGKKITNPWAGGLNSPQFSKMHLNRDAIEDLVVFDRATAHLKTFVAMASTTGYYWKYEPMYERLFPQDLNNWVLLVDYDKDGRKDLFTSVPAGIRVFRNVPASGQVFGWQLASSLLYTEGFSGKLNLYVASTDLPAITDVDNDGDIDIMAFDFSGNTLEYHQNYAKENGNKQAFDFKKVSTCWGQFVKEHCNDFRFNQPCDLFKPQNQNAKVLHSGNAIWVGDLTGDGLKDVLHGHITCQNVARLINVGGNGTAARMGSFDKDFPLQNPTNFKVFPSPYVEDVDFDGKADYLVSPSVFYNEGNLVDMRSSVWYYKNEGTANLPNFVYQQSNFLQGQMIDLGENTSPALSDYDADGDLDLFVSYSNIATAKGYRASVYLYENIGTAQKASFQLKNEDYLEIIDTYQLTNLKIIFEDIDQNGTTDFVFYGSGVNGMELYYVPNASPRGRKANFNIEKTIQLPVPQHFVNGETITFFDQEKNGMLEILVSKNSGNIEHFKNVGSDQSPKYELVTEKFKGFDYDFVDLTKTIALADLNGDNVAEMAMASASGTLKIYSQKTPLKADSLVIWNEITQKNEFLKLNAGLHITTGDLDADGLPEIVLGNRSGGIQILKNYSTKITPTPTANEDIFMVFPNPSKDFIYIKSTKMGVAKLISQKGQILLEREIKRSNSEIVIETHNLASATYIITFIASDGTKTSRKIVINH